MGLGSGQTGMHLDFYSALGPSIRLSGGSWGTAAQPHRPSNSGGRSCNNDRLNPRSVGQTSQPLLGSSEPFLSLSELGMHVGDALLEAGG